MGQTDRLTDELQSAVGRGLLARRPIITQNKKASLKIAMAALRVKKFDKQRNRAAVTY